MFGESGFESKAKIITERAPRVLLRMLLSIPGPEIYDLVKDLAKSRISLDEKVARAYQSLHETSCFRARGGLKESVCRI